MDKSKIKKIIATAPFAVISFQLFFGILIGYFIGKLLCGRKAGVSGFIGSLKINFGDYKIHVHHWMLGIGIMLAVVAYDFLPLPLFSFGLLGGWVFQGVYSYNDWHHILIRRN